MAQSAAVVATAPLDIAALLDRWLAAWKVLPVGWLRGTWGRIADRILAKFAYHNARRYQELLQRAASHIGPAPNWARWVVTFGNLTQADSESGIWRAVRAHLT